MFVWRDWESLAIRIIMKGLMSSGIWEHESNFIGVDESSDDWSYGTWRHIGMRAQAPLEFGIENVLAHIKIRSTQNSLTICKIGQLIIISFKQNDLSVKRNHGTYSYSCPAPVSLS